MNNRDKLVDLLLFANETYSISGRELDTDEVNDFADFLDINDVVVQRWISVEERLPEIGMMVLVHDGSRAYVVEYTKNGLFEDDYGYCHYIDDYTHWMPLPEPPKEE